MENFQLGKFLRQMREKERLSLGQMVERAKRKGVSLNKSQLSRLEKGETNPNLQTLQNLATTLELALNILLDGSATKPDTITILSTSELAQVLDRQALIELLVYCYRLSDEQLTAILTVARAIREVNQSQT